MHTNASFLLLSLSCWSSRNISTAWGKLSRYPVSVNCTLMCGVHYQQIKRQAYTFCFSQLGDKSRHSLHVDSHQGIVSSSIFLLARESLLIVSVNGRDACSMYQRVRPRECHLSNHIYKVANVADSRSHSTDVTLWLCKPWISAQLEFFSLFPLLFPSQNIAGNLSCN